MQQAVTCLALRSVKYSDSSSIATVWSRELGRLAVATPSGAGAEAKRRRAIMMPMGVFEAVATIRPQQEVARLSDIRPLVRSAAAAGHPARSVVAMFLADFLCQALRESPPDDHLSDFLFAQASLLGQASGTALANFHLSFLYRLSRFLGIEPDMGSYRKGACFDMREARFTITAPIHSQWLQPDHARVAAIIARLQPRSLGLLRLSRAQRNQALDTILNYYSIHFRPLSAIPSLPIVREIFS